MIWIVCMWVSILYGISVGYKNSGTFFYLIWFVFGILFYGIYQFELHLSWSQVPTFIWSILFVGFVLFFFILGCIFSKFFSKGVENADYVIVLGAQWKKTGPSKALKYRLDQAYDYLTKNTHTKCIVSGGQGYNEPCSEADGMAEYLINKGIDSSRIYREDQSTSTTENIQFSKQYLDSLEASICICSNAFHIFRAVSIAKKQGLKKAVGLSGRCDLWYLPNNTLREVFGIVKDFMVRNL